MKRTFIGLLMAAALSGPLLIVPMTSYAQISVGLTVNIAPPPLPMYPQPVAPAPGYIWTPGYWAYGADGYYWVPGAWVLAPAVGLLWTPGWWGWSDGYYHWHPGYWGKTVGFYGGINYGYGYPGRGYVGGYWHGNVFYYNRAVSNVNIAYIHTTYDRPVAHVPVSHVSYNGGRGGITLRPTAQQEAFMRQKHVARTAMQTQHERMAGSAPAQRYSVNKGQPDIVATEHAGKFSGPGVVQMDRAQGKYTYHSPTQTQMAPRSGGSKGSQQDHKSKKNNSGAPHCCQLPLGV